MGTLDLVMPVQTAGKSASLARQARRLDLRINRAVHKQLRPGLHQRHDPAEVQVAVQAEADRSAKTAIGGLSREGWSRSFMRRVSGRPFLSSRSSDMARPGAADIRRLP